MVWEAVVLAFWSFLPAYAANPMAVVFGGGTPLDLGRTWRDGRRLLGDGKTWRGLIGGVASGVVLGGVLEAVASLTDPRLSFGPWPSPLLVPFLLSFGALFGDILGAFVKRRMGKERGAKAPGLDQFDFVLGAFLLVGPFAPAWWLARFWTGDAIFGLAFVILITPVLHRVVNVLGYRVGQKHEPW